MKCALCGKEFGSGVNCQNCGADRVTGLANYSGYSIPTNKSVVTHNKTIQAYKNGLAKKDPLPKNINHPDEFVQKSAKTKESVEKTNTNDIVAVQEKYIVCYACGEAIPSNSKYCPMCGRELYLTCPKCGNTYSSQYLFCSQCGTNFKDYFANKEKRKKERKKRKNGRKRS